MTSCPLEILPEALKTLSEVLEALPVPLEMLS